MQVRSGLQYVFSASSSQATATVCHSHAKDRCESSVSLRQTYRCEAMQGIPLTSHESYCLPPGLALFESMIYQIYQQAPVPTHLAPVWAPAMSAASMLKTSRAKAELLPSSSPWHQHPKIALLHPKFLARTIWPRLPVTSCDILKIC